MSPAVVLPAALLAVKSALAHRDSDARCIPQFALPAARSVRSHSSQEVIGQYIVVRASLNKILADGLPVSMSIGALKVRFRFPENQSLKDKRRAIKSIMAQVRNRFNVSIAEIDDQDRWQLATMGITCVSTDRRHANEILSNVMDFLSKVRGDAEILDYEIELFNGP